MVRNPQRQKMVAVGGALCIVSLLLSACVLVAQTAPIVWSKVEKPIADSISSLRRLPDDERARRTKELALQIRQLPSTPNKRTLAYGLASLSTEGDFGHDTLQEVATTLGNSLQEEPLQAKTGSPPLPYIELAQLVRYEHVQVSLNDPQFAAATSKMEADDVRRQQANFTLVDLKGEKWTLKSLAGKVVLVNFWATWCPPCQKEIPDLETLYERFKNQGLIILAISDENVSTVTPFIAKRQVTYPVLLDPKRKVNDLFQVVGIPKSFVYDRSGKLVAQSIDMRTQRQFLEMLGLADLH